MSATRFENENIFSILKRFAKSDPDRNLITADNDSLTRGTLVAEAELLARALARAGVGCGTKVGLVLPNSVLWYVAYWALASLGAIPVPFDPQAGEWELARLLSLADVQVCFAASRYRANDILANLRAAAPGLPGLGLVIATDEHSLSDGKFVSLDGFLGSAQASDTVTPVREPGVDDPLMFACTSGSTGNPRIIVVPHLGFAKSQKDMADYLSFSESDSMLLGMPLYHQGGFGMGIQMAMNGGRVIYQSMFDPEKFTSIIEREKITVLQLTTTLAKILLSVPGFDPTRLTSVRLCYFAGEVLPVEIAREFFGKASIRVVNVIGSTETATMVAWDSLIDSDADSNEFRALPFTKVRVLGENGSTVSDGETGSISIHTDALLSEYYKNESETNARLSTHDGFRWFDTGDLGTLTCTGRIRFAGRLKRIIKRGSNLVYPEELEAFLLTHPSIEAVAVRGEKHELAGEAIIAHIQCRKGESLSRTDIIRFCTGKISAYKMPDRVVFADALPYDIGKIQFKYLEKQIERRNMRPETNKTFNDFYEDFTKTGRPQDPVLHYNETTVTRGEFVSGVDAMRKRLSSLGVGMGTMVGYTLPNCPEAFYLFIALSNLGACAIPLFPMIPDQAKAAIWKNARASFVVTVSSMKLKLEEAAAKMDARFAFIAVDDTASGGAPEAGGVVSGGKIGESLPIVIASSSGTTGLPKLVLMTQANAAALLCAAIEMVTPLIDVEGIGYSSAMAFPLSTAGILNCCGTLFAGVRLIFSPEVSPVRFMQLVTRWKADSLSAPPAYFEAILSLPMLVSFHLSSVRRIFTGMDFFSPSLLERIRAKFPNVDFAANGYGLIETTNVFMIAKAETKESLSGLLGRMSLAKYSGNTIEVRGEDGKPVGRGETGELFVKGRSVVSGYLGNPDETARSFVNGWFSTGDIAVNEGDGSVTLMGRKKYLIKRGGKSVSPVVVQDCINKIPGVKVSAVVGVPHRLYGEMVWAFIVPTQGSALSLKDVMKSLREELVNYMVPDQVSFIDDIPKNPGVGKVDYEKLKSIALAEIEREVGGTNG